MAQVTGYAENIGIFIDAWDENLVEPYKNIVPILASSPFKQVQMVGGVYHVATRLTYEGGQTFAAAQSNVGTTALPYNVPISGQVTDAEVEGSQIHGRSRITYEAIASSMQDVNANASDKKKAVRDATKVVMDGLLQSTLKKVECQMLHGREGLGQLDSANTISNVTACTTGSTPPGPATGFLIDVGISQGTWAEAIWAMFEGHPFDIYSNTSGLPVTKLNTATNTFIGNNETGLILVTTNPSVLLTGSATSGRVLRFFHTASTVQGAPGTANIGGWSVPAAGTQDQHIMFESASPTTEFVGLNMMAGNQGTLFGINSQTYPSFRGNLDTTGGNLTLGLLVRKLSKPINFGAAGTLMRAVVPTELFAKFANDESTLRRYASTTSSAENGFDSIQMYLPMKGVLEILGHNMQKDGVVTCYVPDEVQRVGAQDLDFVNRNAASGKSRRDLVLEVANAPESEVRLFGKFAPICQTPRHMLKLTGVTF